MTIISHTEPGDKPSNEDYVIARAHPLSDKGYVCLLADGQGGRDNGAAASRAACEAVWSYAAGLPFKQLFHRGEWLRILRQADQDVSRTGGFTTLIALAVYSTHAAGASNGDSKTLFMRRRESFEVIEWTQKQRKNPPVGSGAADFQPFSYRTKSGDRILMLSDGAWKYCGADTLRLAFHYPAAEVSYLLKRSVLKSRPTLPDDFSVLVIDAD
jgi:PPM family protein phosphatase